MSKRRKVVLLDRDGTLNVDARGYTHRIEDYELFPRVKEGLKRLQDAGFILIILTSQSGIGRGIFNQKQYEAFMDHMLNDLSSFGIKIKGTFFCPHHPSKGLGQYRVKCDCRKPKAGLVFQAERELGPFDYSSTWAIGNSVRDAEMAKNADSKIRTILVGIELEETKRAVEEGIIDFVVEDMTHAADIILKKAHDEQG